MADNSGFVVVSTTVDDEAVAEKLAAGIVEQKLAACVQRSQVKSTYRWKGKIESAGEYLLAAKTTAQLADRLMDFIKQSHPYEVPEVVVAPISGGHADYLAWIREETA